MGMARSTRSARGALGPQGTLRSGLGIDRTNRQRRRASINVVDPHGQRSGGIRVIARRAIRSDQMT